MCHHKMAESLYARLQQVGGPIPLTCCLHLSISCLASAGLPLSVDMALADDHFVMLGRSVTLPRIPERVHQGLASSLDVVVPCGAGV